MTIFRYLRWLAWTLWYLPQRQPRYIRLDGLRAQLLRMERTRRPWWKWKPGIWHNTDGRQWHVTFSDEQDYTICGTLKAELHIGQETGDIVGLTIFDETLRAKAKATA